MRTWKLAIVCIAFYMATMVISAFLQILIIYSYYRISNRLSTQERQLIAQNLHPKLI